MNGSFPWFRRLGLSLIAFGLLAGTAFGAPQPPAPGASPAAPGVTAPSAAHPDPIDKALERGELTKGEADVLRQLHDLRKARMEQFRSEATAIVEKAVEDGKITREQADRMLRHGKKHRREHTHSHAQPKP